MIKTREGVEVMKKIIKKYWRVVAFYLVVIVAVVSVNVRFEELNEEVVNDSYVIAEVKF